MLILFLTRGIMQIEMLAITITKSCSVSYLIPCFPNTVTISDTSNKFFYLRPSIIHFPNDFVTNDKRNLWFSCWPFPWKPLNAQGFKVPFLEISSLCFVPPWMSIDQLLPKVSPSSFMVFLCSHFRSSEPELPSTYWVLLYKFQGPSPLCLYWLIHVLLVPANFWGLQSTLCMAARITLSSHVVLLIL